jgi:hypothetical protein
LLGRPAGYVVTIDPNGVVSDVNYESSGMQ